MALTREQFDQLYNQGLSVDQIVSFEQGKKPQDLAPQSQPGFVQRTAQTLASPFLKIASSAFSIADQARAKSNAEVDEAVNREYDYGYFGKQRGLKNPLESAGVGAEIGSYLVGGSGATKALATGLKGKILQGAVTGATTGAASGGLSSFGQAIQEAENKPAAIAFQTLFGTAFGGALGGVLGAATPVAVRGAKGIKSYTNLGDLEKKLYESNKSAFKPTSSQLAEWNRMKVDPIKTFTEEFGPEALSTTKGVFDLEESIAQIDARYKAGSEAFNTILRNSPEVINLADRERIALESIESSFLTPSQKVAATTKVQNEFIALKNEAQKKGLLQGDNVPVAYADNLKDRFWGATKNFGTEESSIANAVNRNIGFSFKNGIEESIGDLNVRSYNKRLQELIELKDFLQSKNGKTPATGGKALRYTTRIVGAITGAKGGPLGSIAGAAMGDSIAQALANPNLRTWFIRKQLEKMSPAQRKSLEAEAQEILERMVKSRIQSFGQPEDQKLLYNQLPSKTAATTDMKAPINTSIDGTVPNNGSSVNKGFARVPLVLGAAAATAVSAAASNPKEVSFGEPSPQKEPTVSRGDSYVEPEKLANALMQLESSGGKNKANADEGEMKWLTGLTEIAIKELKRTGLKEKVDVNNKEDVLDASVKYFQLMQQRHPELTPAEIYVDYYWTQSGSEQQRQKKIDEFNKLIS